MELKPGIEHISKITAGENLSAAAMGSGDLPVFATPAMVALMENAAMSAVAPYLPEGSGTVGTKLEITHTRATPLGEDINASAVLDEVDGRRLVFAVSAYDSKGEIGSGTHERFIIDKERFMTKLGK